MGVSYFLGIGIVVGGILALTAWTIRKLLEKHWGSVDLLQEEDVRGKIILITGAGSGIGFETAAEMANRGATVIVTGRTMKAAKKTVINIRHKTFLGKLVPMKVELSSLDSVKKFSEDVKSSFDKIDILILNAGLLCPLNKRMKTADGLEIHFGVNHLSHFLLTNLLLPLLRKADSSRIVILTSVSHRGAKLNFEDLMFEKTVLKQETLSENPLYKASKLANLLFSRELAKRLEKNSRVHVYACCPGIVQTNISRNLDLPWYQNILYPIVSIVFKTPNQGCQTVLYCALSKKCKNETGLLYRNCAFWNKGSFSIPDDIFVPRSNILYSDAECERLWTESEKLCKMNFQF